MPKGTQDPPESYATQSRQLEQAVNNTFQMGQATMRSLTVKNHKLNKLTLKPPYDTATQLAGLQECTHFMNYINRNQRLPLCPSNIDEADDDDKSELQKNRAKPAGAWCNSKNQGPICITLYNMFSLTSWGNYTLLH